MQRSGRRTEGTEAERPVRGAPAVRRETSSAGAAVPPPLTADVLRAAQGSAGNAAVTGMIARRARPAPAPEPVDTGVNEVLGTAGKPMAEPIRQEMESRFNTDFSGVRLHTGAAAARSARAIGARAYTSGSHVVLGDGGGDRHTLAHELTHVVQQRNGPVAGTDQGNGLRVSDPSDRFERAAEANAHRVMASPAPVQRAGAAEAESAGEACSQAAAVPHGQDQTSVQPAVIQRKGHEELSGQLPSPASGNSLKSFLKSFSRGPAQESPVLADIRKGIEAYDGDPKRDPIHCLQQLAPLLLAVSTAQEDLSGMPKAEARAAEEFLAAARRALRAEKDVVTEQTARDNAFPTSAHGPFDAMTSRGMLWNEEAWADSAVAFAMSGPSYFREFSEMNRAGMAKEIGSRGSQGWVDNVKRSLGAALKQSVLCHYTAEDRANQLVRQGAIKSKTELLRENPDAPNNSEAYDKHVLANEGFVFFFLEAGGSEFRETRFGNVRIEIPLEDSPLESQGWLMLSDFAQREYPTINAKPTDPARTASKLPTREEAMPAEFTLPVRSFDLGANKAELDDDKLVDRMEQESDAGRRSQIGYSMTQAAADPHSRMTYGSGDQKKEYEERLRSNTLRGRDIVPGLVDRAVLEIMRLEETNPALAERLKGMSGLDLMKYLLKDLLRPQAMLPNSVDLSKARVRRKS